MRIACLRVPNLPLAAELRAHPELAGQPFVVAAGSEPRADVVAVSPEAERRGVRRMGSVAQARATCPALSVRVASPSLERAAREALLDAALGVSPRAALAPRASGVFAFEAAVHLDASGIASLFHSEEGFATALCAKARAVGLPGDVAVASSRSVAHIAARTLEEPASDDARRANARGGARGNANARKGARITEEGAVRVLPPDGEIAFLAPLPIDLLDPDDSLAETLTRFGVRRVRDLLALPRRATTSRLGPAVRNLVALARGEAREPPLPVPARTALVEAIDLEFAVDRVEPLLFALRGLLSRLLARLEARHLACGDLALALDLAGGSRDARRIGVAAPTLDARALLRLIRQSLESRPPEAAIEAAKLETEGASFRGDQLDLFRPAGPAPAELDRTLAALASLCGNERVGAPAVADDHRPATFAMRPFGGAKIAPGTSSRVASSSKRTENGGERELPCTSTGRRNLRTTSLVVRALRPAVAASVRLHRGTPVEIRSAVANGRVLHAAGPWRTTGGWWSDERFAYDCFDVQTSDGTVSRLRFDHLQKRWEIDAVYD